MPLSCTAAETTTAGLPTIHEKYTQRYFGRVCFIIGSSAYCNDNTSDNRGRLADCVQYWLRILLKYTYFENQILDKGTEWRRPFSTITNRTCVARYRACCPSPRVIIANSARFTISCGDSAVIEQAVFVSCMSVCVHVVCGTVVYTRSTRARPSSAAYLLKGCFIRFVHQ